MIQLHRVEFWGGPKDGEVYMNLSDPLKIMFFEEQDYAEPMKYIGPDGTETKLHKYELRKKNDKWCYIYQGLV